MMTSVKISTILRAVAASSVRLSATTPPYAETGSHDSAFSYASSRVAPTATPQGLACLMIAAAADSSGANSATSSKAASVSLRLL